MLIIISVYFGSFLASEIILEGHHFLSYMHHGTGQVSCFIYILYVFY